MFERFTAQARAVVISARMHARALHSERIEPVHLFLGALEKADEPLSSALAKSGFTLHNALEDVRSTDARALRSIGIDLADVIDTVETAVGFGAVDRPNEIGVEHILLGVVRGADPWFTELVSVRGTLDELRSTVLLVRMP